MIVAPIVGTRVVLLVSKKVSENGADRVMHAVGPVRKQCPAPPVNALLSLALARTNFSTFNIEWLASKDAV